MTNTLSTSLPLTKKALAKQDVSLGDVVKAIQLDALAERPTAPKVTLPKKVETTEAQRTHVAELLSLLDDLKLPTTRRKLRAAEKRQILAWTEQAKDVEKLVKTVVEQLKAAFFNHADLVAEEQGRAVPGETLRHKDGWYLLEDKDAAGVVDGESMKMVREYRSGSFALTVDDLNTLVAEGVLSEMDRHEAVTTVEVVDETAVMKLLADRPHLIKPVVAKVKQTSAPSVAFALRENK
jgi:hypothetical protein